LNTKNMRSVKTKYQQVIAVSAHGSGGQISIILETVCIDVVSHSKYHFREI